MENKISSKDLQAFFLDALSGVEYTLLKGLNPFLLDINQEKYYVYIKNLSSAYFTNKDVWRVQLPIKEEFDFIKQSETKFVLLGYDYDNDVYATWNPVWSKQRLNIAKSVSFYSRLSLQKKVVEEGRFENYDLQNDGKVLAFPRYLLPQFFDNFNNYFSYEGDYIALGSKRRALANNTYKVFIDSKNLMPFAEYLSDSGLLFTTIEKYLDVIKLLINGGYIIRNKRIFMACDTIDDYLEMVPKFVAIPEVARLNEQRSNLIFNALTLYIKYLSKFIMNEKTVDENNYLIDELNDNAKNNVSEEYGDEYDIDRINTDSRGHLTRIANPKLIELLKPYLVKEYRELSTVFNIIDDFYKGQYECMELSEWYKLIDSIDWSNPYEGGIERTKKTSSRQKIKVVFPNGQVVKNKRVVDTLLSVIEYAGDERVKEIGLMIGRHKLITNYPEHDHLSAYKKINNIYVNTYSSTQSKYEHISEINARLKLGLTVLLE